MVRRKADLADVRISATAVAISLPVPAETNWVTVLLSLQDDFVILG